MRRRRPREQPQMPALSDDVLADLIALADRYGLPMHGLAGQNPRTSRLVCAWCLDLVPTRAGCRAMAIFLSDEDVVVFDRSIVVLDIDNRPVMGIRLRPDMPFEFATMGFDVLFPLCSRRCEDALDTWLMEHRTPTARDRVH